MKDNSWFYIPVLSFLVLACVVLLALFINGPSDSFQDYICEANKCTLQDWLSATAGWIGFVAAAAAAYLVFGQLSEQRKQTAFMLGDAPPTIELYRTSLDERRAMFEITNWNRRRIEILGLKILSSPFDLPKPEKINMTHSESHEGDLNLKCDGDGEWEYALSLGGWLNRSTGPHFVRLEIVLDGDGEKGFFDSFTKEQLQSDVYVVVECRASDQVYSLDWRIKLSHFLPRFKAD